MNIHVNSFFSCTGQKYVYNQVWDAGTGTLIIHSITHMHVNRWATGSSTFQTDGLGFSY